MSYDILDRDPWFNVYETLEEPKQILLQLCSVHYGGLHSTEIYQCFRNMGIRGPKGKPIEQTHVRLWLNQLEKDQLLQRMGTTYYVPRICMEDLTLRAANADRLKTMWDTLNLVHPSYRQNQKAAPSSANLDSLTREWRVWVYEQEWINAEKLLSQHEPLLAREQFHEHPYVLLFRNMYDLDWFFSLPVSFLERGFCSVLGRSLRDFTHCNDIYECLDMYCSDTEVQPSPILSNLWRLQTFLRGDFDRLEQSLQATSDVQVPAWLGCLALVRGQQEEAKELLESSWNRNSYAMVGTLGGVFLCLLWSQGDQESLQRVESYLNQKQSGYLQSSLTWIHPYLQTLLEIRKGQHPLPATALDSISKKPGTSPFEQWWWWLLVLWNTPELANRYPSSLERLQLQSARSGYKWLHFEACAMFDGLPLSAKNELKGGAPFDRESAQEWQTQTSSRSLLSLFKPNPAWEHSLNALLSVAKREQAPVKEETSHDERLIWLLNLKKGIFSLSPRIQKRSPKGTWSAGRHITLQSLIQDAEKMKFLLQQDREICATLQMAALKKSGFYYSLHASSNLEYYKDQILPMLAGHPLVFLLEQPNARIDIITGEPIVRIVQEKNTLYLFMVPHFRFEQKLLVEQESPVRIRLYQPTESHLRLSEVLGEKGIQVPVEAQQRVLDVIGIIAPLVTIHSDIGGSTEKVEEVQNDARLYIDLFPWEDGLKVHLFCLPFGEKGVRSFPGEGAASVFSRIDNKAYHTERDLVHEKIKLAELMKSCPILGQAYDETGEWIVEELDTCLELVMFLQTLGDGYVIRWPQGKRWQVKKRLSSEQVHWNISGSQDWFEASASVAVDENEVIELQTLMRLMELSPGRFLQLRDGQFLALTEEFRKRLEDFRSFSQGHGKVRRFHASAALAVEDLLKDAENLNTSKHWQEHCERLHTISQKHFDIPVDFKATLRNYQVDGFLWLSRLAHLRFGACLSDEMGLGKTLQTLALLVARAPDGPALVVAPTSVCLNWIDEASRFAPHLRMISFGTRDRQTILDDLEPMDVMVCSYALLQYEIEKISKVSWYTVILDEAQAIKNSLTKRSKAAMELMGDFKMITTGTPIENHLGEFWNLFNFLNPGLLGGWEHFQKTFGNPIERNQDAEAREQLKKLVQPFVLRRRKVDVLRELPPRTEIILPVELSSKEMALYEALRQQALQRIRDMSSIGTGQQHIQILAELTRLRLACCHPQLVMPESDLPSSKLQILQDTLEELLENRHKVLIFSQFVTHLQLIVGLLERQHIAYQYLDGSTPMKERKRRIDAFQAGQGDVFLLSLKAGGFGVNLTAADYVIHMDPWWNPAVEDQASDRAHRIGQTKPVTVYRLITRHTVEEKIVELHNRKRDLAESLLDGSDMSGKMSTDELVALIRSGV